MLAAVLNSRKAINVNKNNAHGLYRTYCTRHKDTKNRKRVNRTVITPNDTRYSVPYMTGYAIEKRYLLPLRYQYLNRKFA